MNKMQKNCLLIAALYRRYIRAMTGGPVIAWINTLERFAYGQANDDALALTTSNLYNDCIISNARTLGEISELLLTNSEKALNKAIVNLAAIYEIYETGIFNNLSEEQIAKKREEKLLMIIDYISQDEADKLPVLFS